MVRTLLYGVILAALGSAGGFVPAYGEQPLREVIDAEIRRAWEREKITPAAPADDATFLRRVSLDLAGVIPSADEASAFLADTSADKRAKLIDRLLESPRYAQHQADVWDLVFFGRNPPGFEADKRGGFQKWLNEAFARNMPYDAMVRTLLRGEGNTAEQGAPMYLVQYAGHPEDAAMSVSQVFLGVQLQCARCHDHPHESWKQTDFYGMAAFFNRLVIVKNGKEKELEKVYLAEMNTGELKFGGKASEQKPGKDGTPMKPKFLLAAELEEPDFSQEFKDEKRPSDGKTPSPPKFSRKDKLAEWVTAAENPYLARAVVNRVWAQFMGKGLVHPVDNMSPANKPSHPELLAALAREFTAHKFDMKWLVREIVSSKTYQLASSGEVAEAMPLWYERARARPLSAEELVESWRVATAYDEVVKQSGKKTEGRFQGLTWDYMKQFFGEPVTGTGAFQGGLNEHLYLNNGELGRLLGEEKGGLMKSLSEAKDAPEAKVDRLFLSILSRKPSEDERAKFVEYISAKEQPNERLREAAWTLMTCSEFRFNH